MTQIWGTKSWGSKNSLPKRSLILNRAVKNIAQVIFEQHVVRFEMSLHYRNQIDIKS